MLGTLSQNKQSSWRDMAPTLGHAYNCSRSTATRFSPYYLMYGQKLQLPVNLYFGTQKADMNAATSTKFVQQLFGKTKMGLQNTPNVIEKVNQRHKQNYDHKIRCTQLEVGDQVPLIQDCWEHTVHHVERQLYSRLPVFRITPVTGEVR